jgi:hypothetical protein
MPYITNMPIIVEPLTLHGVPLEVSYDVQHSTGDSMCIMYMGTTRCGRKYTMRKRIVKLVRVPDSPIIDDSKPHGDVWSVDYRGLV